MTAGERIRTIREKLGLDQIQFAAGLDIRQGSYSAIENDRVGLSYKVRNKLFEVFRINIDYIIDGEGEMFTDPDFAKQAAMNIRIGPIAGRPESGTRILQKETSVNKRIPYYDVDFSAGKVAVFNDHSEEPAYYIDINPFNDCDFAVRIFGDSMYPMFQNGDTVICKAVNDISVIIFGEAYLIITDEHRMLKYIRKGTSDDNIMVVSENKELYDPFTLPIKKIRKLFIVKGVIKRKAI